MRLFFVLYIYKLLNGGWFWELGAMIRESMMKFSGSRTMRTSAIGIWYFFEINQKIIFLEDYIRKEKMFFTNEGKNGM